MQLRPNFSKCDMLAKSHSTEPQHVSKNCKSVATGNARACSMLRVVLLYLTINKLADVKPASYLYIIGTYWYYSGWNPFGIPGFLH